MHQRAKIIKPIILVLLFVSGTFSFVNQAHASGTLRLPITLTASEPVSAAELYFHLDGAEMVGTECNSTGWIEMIGELDRCVIFTTQPIEQATIGHVIVRPTAGRVELQVEGLVSTNKGTLPTEYSFEGGTYRVVTNKSGKHVSYSLGDVDGDGSVGPFDLGIVAGMFGKDVDNKSSVQQRLSDLNDDGQINVYDLGEFIDLYDLESPNPS